MKPFKREFKKRVEEIEAYYELLLNIDSIETHRRQKIIFPNETKFVVKRTLQKTLRANCFLLLYNLVEASIRNGVLAIFDAIHDSNLTYQELSEKVKEIWLTNKASELAKNTNNKRVKKDIKLMLSDVINNADIFLEKGRISISGNLDYRRIETIINDYGIHRSVSQRKEISKALLRIKSERNSLAHGNKSFQKAAELITVPELVKCKDLIVKYLEDVLNGIEIYIDNQEFKS